MKFEEFQREWESVKIEPKSHTELRRMMYASPVWRFRRLTRKEVRGLAWYAVAVLSLIFLFDAFGNMGTAFMTLTVVVQVLDQYFGLRYLRFLPQKDTMQQTLANVLIHIKRRAIISRVVNVLIWIALVYIMGTSVPIGSMNMILWALVLLPLLVAIIWWNSRMWSKQKDEVKAMLKEFGEEASVAAV